MEGILSKAQSRCTQLCALIFNHPSAKPPTRAEELIAALNETKAKLSALEHAFDLETDFDRIDASIFEIEACKRQYSYLLKCAKREHITAF